MGKLPLTQDITISTREAISFVLKFCGTPPGSTFSATAKPVFSKTYTDLIYSVGNVFTTLAQYQASLYSPRLGERLRQPLRDGDVIITNDPNGVTGVTNTKFWPGSAINPDFLPEVPLPTSYSQGAEELTVTIGFGSSFNGQEEYLGGASPRRYAYSVFFNGASQVLIATGAIILNLETAEDGAPSLAICSASVSGGESTGPPPNPGGSF